MTKRMKAKEPIIECGLSVAMRCDARRGDAMERLKAKKGREGQSRAKQRDGLYLAICYNKGIFNIFIRVAGRDVKVKVRVKVKKTPDGD